MYHKHSSRQQKTSEIRPQTSPQTSPPEEEEVIQRRTRGRVWRPRGGGGAVDTDKDRVRDVLDLISATDDVQYVSGGNKEQAVVITDTGLDESDEDSDSSGIISGPSQQLWASQRPCTACLRLYQKAKRAKKTIKGKLLDNDPKSLTCDQWVLLKRRTPRRVATARRKLLCQLRFDKQVDAAEAEISSCSRPHPFLQRNLRCVKMSLNKSKRKKNKMKRPRADSSWSRAAKQQRLQATSNLHHVSISSVEDSPSSCQEIETQADTSVSAEPIPSFVTPKTTEPRETPFEGNLPRQKRGFRELLAQLRGSTIVREIQ